MSLTDRLPAGADTAGFVPETWSKNAIVDTAHNTVLVPLCDHTWEAEIKQKGDTVNIGLINTIVATEVTVGTPGPVDDILEGTKLQLVADQYYEAKAELDDMTDIQAQIDLKSKAQFQTQRALARQIDSSIGALFASLNGASILGTDGSAVTDDVCLACVEELDLNDVPQEDRVWVFDPSTKRDFLGEEKFVSKDYVKMQPVVSGKFGELYGSPMYMTTNLASASTGHYGAYFHKEAIAIAIQKNWKSVIVHEPLKHLYTIQTKVLWGVLETRDTFGQAFYTRA